MNNFMQILGTNSHRSVAKTSSQTLCTRQKESYCSLKQISRRRQNESECKKAITYFR